MDLFDSIRGIYVDGINWRFDSLYKIKKNANYTKKWERHVYVEMFDSQGDVILDQNAGIRIFGGLTRFYPEKSLRIIARKRYGQSRFDANIFGVGVKNTNISIDFSTLNESNEVAFGVNSDGNVIAVTNVWGVFGGPPHGREIVEWDMVFNNAYLFL